VIEVEAATRPDVHVGSPRKLFGLAQGPVAENESPVFDVTPYGEGFVMVEALEPIPGMVVVQNWLGSTE
jgi:hypothetical protein